MLTAILATVFFIASCISAQPGGSWNCLAADSSGATIVAAQYEGGIYTSTTFGKTWNAADIVSSTWADVAVAGNGNTIAATDYTHAYITNDGGSNWSLMIESIDTWRAVCLSEDARYINLVAEKGNFAVSSSYGAVWNTTNSTLTQSFNDVACDLSGQHVVQAAAAGVLYSSDFGNTSSFKVIFAEPAGAACTVVAINSNGSGAVLAALFSNYAAFFSADFGQTWSSIPIPLGQVWESISIDGTGQHIFAGGADILYLSSDYGASWPALDAPVSDWDQVWITYDAQNLSAVQTNGAIYTSSSAGVSWTLHISNCPAGTGYSLVSTSTSSFSGCDSCCNAQSYCTEYNDGGSVQCSNCNGLYEVANNEGTECVTPCIFPFVPTAGTPDDDSQFNYYVCEQIRVYVPIFVLLAILGGVALLWIIILVSLCVWYPSLRERPWIVGKLAFMWALYLGEVTADVLFVLWAQLYSLPVFVVLSATLVLHPIAFILWNAWSLRSEPQNRPRFWMLPIPQVLWDPLVREDVHWCTSLIYGTLCAPFVFINVLWLFPWSLLLVVLHLFRISSFTAVQRFWVRVWSGVQLKNSELGAVDIAHFHSQTFYSGVLLSIPQFAVQLYNQQNLPRHNIVVYAAVILSALSCAVLALRVVQNVMCAPRSDSESSNRRRRDDDDQKESKWFWSVLDEVQQFTKVSEVDEAVFVQENPTLAYAA